MMDTLTTSPILVAAWLGLAAGFAVAIPLGPIGLLIVDRGMRHGRNVGLAAAAGVATTDLVYGSLALTATAWATRVIDPIARPSTYLAAGVIAAIGLRGVLQRRVAPTGEPHADPAPQAATARPVRTFVGFVALTAINPATVLAFAALTLALSDRLDSPATRLAFLVGISVASLSWQAALAHLGARLGRRPRPAMQQRTRQAGGLLMLILAALLAANAT